MLNKLFYVLTRRWTRIPLFRVEFDLEKYKREGPAGSCDCLMHPAFRDDKHLKTLINLLLDYVRETYDMEELV